MNKKILIMLLCVLSMLSSFSYNSMALTKSQIVTKSYLEPFWDHEDEVIDTYDPDTFSATNLIGISRLRMYDNTINLKLNEKYVKRNVHYIVEIYAKNGKTLLQAAPYGTYSLSKYCDKDYTIKDGLNALCKEGAKETQDVSFADKNYYECISKIPGKKISALKEDMVVVVKYKFTNTQKASALEKLMCEYDFGQNADTRKIIGNNSLVDAPDYGGKDLSFAFKVVTPYSTNNIKKFYKKDKYKKTKITNARTYAISDVFKMKPYYSVAYGLSDKKALGSDYLTFCARCVGKSNWPLTNMAMIKSYALPFYYCSEH